MSDGMFLLSNVVRIDVRPPVSRADHAVAELASGEEQGVLMSLVGSDAPELRRGNEALRTIVERYPEHPVASVARLVHATNAAREFKAIQIDGSVNVREARTQEAAAILHRAPGLEALLHAAVLSNDEASLPRAVAELLTRVPSDVTSAHVLHPFIRSRIKEISSVVPQVLARRGGSSRQVAGHVVPDEVSGSLASTLLPELDQHPASSTVNKGSKHE